MSRRPKRSKALDSYIRRPSTPPPVPTSVRLTSAENQLLQEVMAKLNSFGISASRGRILRLALDVGLPAVMLRIEALAQEP